MATAGTSAAGRSRGTLWIVLIIELVLLMALIGSGFWEGSAKLAGPGWWVIGTVTHGVVSGSVWNRMPAFPGQTVRVETSGNAVVPDPSDPALAQRWIWTPRLHVDRKPIGPQVYGIRVPIWMLALVPLGMVIFGWRNRTT